MLMTIDGRRLVLANVNHATRRITDLKIRQRFDLLSNKLP